MINTERPNPHKQKLFELSIIFKHVKQRGPKTRVFENHWPTHDSCKNV